jgi:hypothetical protein
MRNMSFSKTTEQFKEDKDITRRLGWKKLKPGERFMGIEKGQGLKKGEKVVRLGERVCVSNIMEPVNAIIRRPYRDNNPRSECEREGFPTLSPEEFVQMFCMMNKCTPDWLIQRIEFKRIA